MANLSVRLEKRMLDELDRIAGLLKIDRATIVKRILDSGIERQKIEVAIDLYQKGETLEKAANISGAALWDLFDEMKQRGITKKFDLEHEKDTMVRIFAKNNKDLAERIRNL